MAGSDSGGGAGIQADLKTFSALGIFGKTIITSVTSQNSFGVQSTYDLPVKVVEQQLNAISEDKKCQAVKTGMLGNEETVLLTVKMIKKSRLKNVVVDPVIFSSSGKRLLTQGGVESLKEKLLPLASLVTPNIKEAEILSGIKIKNESDRKRAAKAILKSGVRAVLITGGHLKGNPDDLLLDNKGIKIFPSERFSKTDIHGTGCVFSAALTAELANGIPLREAVQNAKEYIGQAILGSVASGNGVSCADPLAAMCREIEKSKSLCDIEKALEIFKKERIGNLVPEVQTNIGLGLSNAKRHEDVLAIPGRVIKNGEDIFTGSRPQFGGSRHVANIVLTVMQHDPEMRAVINIKYTDALLRICKKLKFKIASFDRAKEPKKVRVREGSSLEWGTEKAITGYGSVPDIIYDLGGIRKEEMIRVIAEDMESLVEKVLAIHRLYKKEA
ncbi:MAG: bifunctional hydroxymethylpyrimidine kinase/phosphomethylpyrimidine kinase [Nitrospina sp.]|nr:bifunctional hydroxymethylpyrimidine kinase/phosphomethylpyrimidine kinase [Nitrospina sp.]MBT6716454.1 bifunctional hydroxymethylpyrimidine kinase/phosphomethylpyrimidine kinase [Nitrospina sp.]